MQKLDDDVNKIKRLLEEAKARERALKRGPQRSVKAVETEIEAPLEVQTEIEETADGEGLVGKKERDTQQGSSPSGGNEQEKKGGRPMQGADKPDNNAGNVEGDNRAVNAGQENKDDGGVAGENNGGEDKGETNNEKDKDKDDEEGKSEKDKGKKEGDGEKTNEQKDNKDSEGGEKSDKDIADELEESKNRERASRDSGDRDSAGREPQSGVGAGDGDNWDWKKAIQGDGNIARNVANYAKERAKKKAKKEVKKLAKTVFKRFIWPVLIAIFGNPITWIVILAIFCFAVLISYCDSFFIRTASKVASITSPAPDFCSVFKGISGGSNVATRSGESETMFVNIPREYVSISNFGDSKSDYPRTKQAALSLVELVFQEAKQSSLNITITSALRKSPPYALTCHVYGEAIDFVLVPPPGGNTDPRIDKLLQIVRNAGFGTVLDEYRSPTDRATGPHVHANLGSDPNCRGYTERPPASEYYMPY